MIDTQLASLITAALFIIIGLFGTIFLDNIIKKAIALSFIADGANLFLVSLGYKAGGVVYIYLPGIAQEWFIQNSSYPLPYALVLTSIVIGASTLAVLLGLVIILYKKHGTLSAKEMLEGDK